MKIQGEIHEVRGMPGVWVASVEIDGRFSCRTEDVSDADTRAAAMTWLRSRLAQLGEPGAPIRERRS